MLETETYTLTLDRDLPIPVGVQLRGQIEYGVATGEIARGSALALGARTGEGAEHRARDRLGGL